MVRTTIIALVAISSFFIRLQSHALLKQQSPPLRSRSPSQTTTSRFIVPTEGTDRSWSVSVDSPFHPDMAVNQAINYRRVFLSNLLASTVYLSSRQAEAVAEDENVLDIFNADGSLKDKDSIVVEAQFRTISLSYNENDDNLPQVWVDGLESPPVKTIQTSKTSTIQYQLPGKWDNRYVDSTTQERACTRISLYRVPFSLPISNEYLTNRKRTMKAATSLSLADIVNALPKDDSLRSLLSGADLISGQTRRSGDVLYSEFDVAVAPPTCSGSDPEDLRLGFCPYDRICLISAAHIMNKEELAVILVQSTKQEWQRANAELRRVRRSFDVMVA